MDLMNVEKHMCMMGVPVRDKVTGFEGAVTCVSFDLYGCVQCIVTPKAGKDGELKDGKWFDIARLQKTGSKPVMPTPDYDFDKGPCEKPAGRL